MTTKVIRRAQLIKGGDIIKQGETFTLGFRLFDANDRIIQLESADVVTVKIANRTGVIKEVTASKVDDYIEFTVNESIGHGEMRVEFTVTNGLDIQKYPARDWIKLTITQSLDDLGAGGVQALTVQQFRQEFDVAVAALTQDSEVVLARDGETVLWNRLARDKQELSSQLAEKAKESDLLIERERISNLTAEAGNTDGNAELLDIRVGFDGVTYPTAGDATRALSNYMTEENESWVI